MSHTDALIELLTSLADDELLLGHRNAEWTGHAPILEEDIAFSNIAQDEIGHSLIWFSLLEPLNGRSPDHMAFVRPARDFRCCRFVTYPKGDFAYTVVRQYLFDEAEQVRLASLSESRHDPLRSAATRIQPEESYHLMHIKGLLLRLGTATEESHRRMQTAVDAAFAQAHGLFEPLVHESDLAAAGIIAHQSDLRDRWYERVLPVLRSATLGVPVLPNGSPDVTPDHGGRRGAHTADLVQALSDLQRVFGSEAGASW